MEDALDKCSMHETNCIFINKLIKDRHFIKQAPTT